eukprot:TRINITY_DN3245_c0_g2_i5.p1 TRINITY_DN3245_c0_g2~~TRINITY_DN3245_c0_g2_i5.p1  ORF type:complete len:258 (+),score=49.23 TRINITY_DN3245_c0_g2_i5:606-1379(+)
MKPDNFLIGGPKKTDTVYLIDYGLAKHYVNEATEIHIPYREGKKLTGTARFVSIRTHQGCEQARRDDLEGICYMMIYFMRKCLPWQGISAKSQEIKYEIIKQLKIKHTPELLCKGLPSIIFILSTDELKEMLKYSMSLEFEETPNYEYLRALVRKMLKDREIPYDNKYDWSNPSISTYYKDPNSPNESNIEDLNHMAVDTSLKENEGYWTCEIIECTFEETPRTFTKVSLATMAQAKTSVISSKSNYRTFGGSNCAL